MKLPGLVVCLCLIHGTNGFLAQMFGANGLFGGRLGTLMQNRLRMVFQGRGGPNTGPPSICQSNECLRYTVIEKTPTYERRRYEGMTVLAMQSEPGWMQNIRSTSALKNYFKKGENSQGLVMNLTYPILKPVNVTAGSLTLMALPQNMTSPPPNPTNPSLRLDNLPPMEVLVKSYTQMFDSEPNEEIQQFRNALGPRVTLASKVAFIAEFNSGFSFMGSRNEIWLVADYPTRVNGPRYPAVDAQSWQPAEVEPAEAAELAG